MAKKKEIKEKVIKGSCYPVRKDFELMKKKGLSPNDVFKIGLEEFKKQHYPEQVKPDLKQYNKGEGLGHFQDFSHLIVYAKDDRAKQKPLISPKVFGVEGFQRNDLNDFNKKLQTFLQTALENKSVYHYELVCEEYVNGKSVNEIDFEAYADPDNYFIVSQNSYVNEMVIQFRNDFKPLVLLPDKNSETYKKQEELKRVKDTQLQHLQTKQQQEELEKKKWIEDKKKRQDEEAWKEHKGETGK